MGLQARLSEHDPRLYNVNRDVAHCFGTVMREVAARLEDDKWQVLVDYLRREKVTMDQLGAACQAAIVFVQSSTDHKKEKMGEALARSGWHAVPEPAQVALCAIMGTVLLGIFWVGVREATLGGVGPVQSLGDLQEAGARAARLVSRRPWARRWDNFRIWLSGVWRALRGK
jgi:hypothetical protein